MTLLVQSLKAGEHEGEDRDEAGYGIRRHVINEILRHTQQQGIKGRSRKMRNLRNVKDDRLKYALHRGNLYWSVNPNADLKLSSKKIHCIIQDADVDIHRKCWYIIQRHEERLQGEKQRVASILKRRHKGDIEINENPV